MSDLNIDTTVLIEAGHSLRLVATEFEHASDNSDDAADAVGDDDLADRLKDFTGSWDDKRADMMDNIKNLAEAASQTGEAFEQLDSDLAAALKGEK